MPRTIDDNQICAGCGGKINVNGEHGFCYSKGKYFHGCDCKEIYWSK